MSYVSTSLAAQRASYAASSAQYEAMRASDGLMDLARKGGDWRAVHAKEQQLEAQKLRAETEAKVARAQKEALKKKEQNKKNKLNLIA